MLPEPSASGLQHSPRRSGSTAQTSDSSQEIRTHYSSVTSLSLVFARLKPDPSGQKSIYVPPSHAKKKLGQTHLLDQAISRSNNDSLASEESKKQKNMNGCHAQTSSKSAPRKIIQKFEEIYHATYSETPNKLSKTHFKKHHFFVEQTLHTMKPLHRNNRNMKPNHSIKKRDREKCIIPKKKSLNLPKG